jgi:CHAD domain-containing protein
MPASKWIPGTHPRQSLAKAARRAIAARLGEVCRLLPLAAEHAAEDVEHVHQLRVASRRAVAALDVLDDVLPRKQRKWMRKQLKRVRKAAGDARDYDVMLARLAQRRLEPSEVERTNLDRSDTERSNLERSDVERRLCELRCAAQAPLRQVHCRLKDKDWERRGAELCAGLRWRGSKRQPNFRQAARRRLRSVLRKFLRAARGDFADLQLVHEFRIAGKRLRYAMELFAGAMPGSFRKQLYPRVEDLQERLGRLNDHVTAVRRLESCAQEAAADSASPFLDLARQESEELRTAHEEFRGWWTPKLAREWRDEFEKYLR